MVLASGTASVGILKPVVGASATLVPAVTVQRATPLAPLKPVVTTTVKPVAVPVTAGPEQRALPRPDSVPSLTWITVGLLAAAGLSAYLIFHG